MKFLALVLIFLVFEVRAAELMLTDKTNPKTKVNSLAECLQSVDTAYTSDRARVNQANNKIYDCIMQSPESTQHEECIKGAKRIHDNKEFQAKAVDHCNTHFAESATCVKSTQRAARKLPSLQGEKQKTAEFIMQEKARTCIKNYASNFSPKFCTDLMETAGLSADKELKEICTIRHENAPPSVTPAGGQQNRR